MKKSKNQQARRETGQSIVETVLMMPFLLFLLLNALNFGYYFLVTLNLTAAPRSGVEYSMIGSQSPGATGLPPAAGTGTNTVTYLTYQDLTGALSSPGSAKIQVCSKILGTSGSGTSTVAKCETCTSSSSCSNTPGAGSPAPDADPEAAKGFVLNRVDVTYSFVPLIPATPFNVALLASGACKLSGGNMSCTFHRQSSMRALD
jgi:Flp pilus assembly protein TadG